jgi:hypothetical protein
MLPLKQYSAKVPRQKKKKKMTVLFHIKTACPFWNMSFFSSKAGIAIWHSTNEWSANIRINEPVCYVKYLPLRIVGGSGMP